MNRSSVEDAARVPFLGAECSFPHIDDTIYPAFALGVSNSRLASFLIPYDEPSAVFLRVGDPSRGCELFRDEEISIHSPKLSAGCGRLRVCRRSHTVSMSSVGRARRFHSSSLSSQADSFSAGDYPPPLLRPRVRYPPALLPIFSEYGVRLATGRLYGHWARMFRS